MLKISVISNTPSSQLFVGTSFIAQNFILKSSKFHCLAWNCPDKFKCSLVTMATAFKKWTISLENDVWHLWDFNTIHHRNNVSVKSKLQHTPPPGNPPGIWLFWKLLFKFPPTRAKIPFKCPTLGSIQVIKCPHPGDISQAQKWQKDDGSCRTKYL